ncbi:MAG: glycine betaine/L-proline ABC transporter ATP-binding protein [Dehalococcoidia bacterium]
MSSTVEVRNLYKIFGDSPKGAIDLLKEGMSKDEILAKTGNVVGLADVSFSVTPGEIFMVMGLSGSGKSTLVRCINRLIQPTAGSVLIDDEDIVRLDDERLREVRRTKISMVFQHFGLFPHRTVVENAEYGLKVQGVPQAERRKKATETLEMVGLKDWADHRPDSLSGGMRQRVGLARALATDPEVLLMDEAFSALDPLIKREMQDELVHIQRELQKTIIFITHDLNEALKLGDRTAVMKDGRIVQIGTPEEIVSGPANDYVADFTRDVDRGRVLTAGSVMRRPETLLAGHDTVRTAMARMAALDEDAMYMVDRQGRPVGLVIDDDIARAVRAGQRDLSEVANVDFPCVEESVALSETFGLCAQNLPVAVRNDSGRLTGVLNQFDVLSRMSGDGAEVGDNASADASTEAGEPVATQ